MHTFLAQLLDLCVQIYKTVVVTSNATYKYAQSIIRPCCRDETQTSTSEHNHLGSVSACPLGPFDHVLHLSSWSGRSFC
jgi:hypothetical protein